MKKINIAELLKDCPKGMELDCTMYEDVYFDYVDELHIIHCYIQHEMHKTSVTFNLHGAYNSAIKSKCVIFPKGKTTWEGFHRPFKDGDILATDLGSVFYLNTRLNTDECYGCYVGKGGDGSFHICEPFAYKECCGLATEEEKQKLFDAIKANGYKWDDETKTLEKLIEPKFKVGDRIKHRLTGDVYKVLFISSNGCGGGVYDVAITNEIGKSINIKEQDSYELVPNKFDITTLKPFDKMLVRIDKNWWADWFSHIDSYKNICCIRVGAVSVVIPYEGNEHLLGTTDDCDDYYKTWE